MIIVCNEQFAAAKLIVAIDSELTRRELDKPTVFAAPGSWLAYPKKLRTFVPAKYASIEASVDLVGLMVNPVLSGEISDAVWDFKNLTWVKD